MINLKSYKICEHTNINSIGIFAFKTINSETIFNYFYFVLKQNEAEMLKIFEIIIKKIFRDIQYNLFSQFID